MYILEQVLSNFAPCMVIVCTAAPALKHQVTGLADRTLSLQRAGFQQLQVLFPPALDCCWEHQKLAKHEKLLLTLSVECLFTGLLGLLLWPRKLRNHPRKGCTTCSCDLLSPYPPVEKVAVGCLTVAEFQTFLF